MTPHSRRWCRETWFAAAVMSLAASRAHAAPRIEVQTRVGYGTAGHGSPVEYAPDPDYGFPRYLPDRILGLPGGYDYSRSDPYGAGLLGQLFVGIRPIEYFSAGFVGTYRASSTTVPDEAYSELRRRGYDIGAYVRGYYTPVARLEAWLSLGIGYTYDVQKYQENIERVLYDRTTEFHGYSIPVTFGVSYVATPLISMGPSVQYARVVPVRACWTASGGGDHASYCTDGEPSWTKASGFGVWSAAIDLRLTL